MNQATLSHSARYGDVCATYYDEIYGSPSKPMISRLREWAGTGEVLELGIGTGRTAIPLFRAGVPISGIEASTAMLERLRSKPEGAFIPVLQADFTDAELPRRYSMIFALCSTIHLLASVSLQRRCFHSMSRHLTPNGLFVVEASVPFAEESTSHGHGDCRAHSTRQRHIRTSISLPTSCGERTYRLEMWKSGPEELDEMAKAANLQLMARWADWNYKPFTVDSHAHVSLYTSGGLPGA